MAILLLLLIMYVPVFVHWVNGWLYKTISIEHEYFSHGLIGFPFAIYILWLQRDKWRELPDQNHPLWLGLITLGGVFYLTGLTDWVNLSFPIILIGICGFLKGIPGLKLQFFPLLLVVLATPNQIPYLISPYSLPLQRFIASVAGFILIQFGLNVTVEEIYLFVGGRIVEVAPFCAGLKMLFTNLYVTMMLLYWTDAWRSRLNVFLMIIGTIIISVTGNIIRNTFLTYFHGTGKEDLFRWLHEGWGGDVYSACQLGAIMLLIHLIQNWLPQIIKKYELNQ